MTAWKNHNANGELIVVGLVIQRMEDIDSLDFEVERLKKLTQTNLSLTALWTLTSFSLVQIGSYLKLVLVLVRTHVLNTVSSTTLMNKPGLMPGMPA